MPPWLRGALLLCCATLLAAGCKEEKKTAPAKTAPAKTASTKTTPASKAPAPQTPVADGEPYPGPGKPPVIKVVNTGGGAKRKLRYRLQSGAEESMLLAMDMGLRMARQGIKLPETALPLWQMAMSLKVESVKGDRIRYRFRFGKVDLKPKPTTPPAAMTAIRASLKGIETLRGEAEITDRGVSLHADIKAQGAVNPKLQQLLQSIKQSLNQLCAPLPEQAVGVGAEWKLYQRNEMGGMTVLQRADYKLVALEGDKVRMKVTVTQKAARQTLRTPGPKIELLSLRGSGKGQMAVNLTRLVPRSRIELESKNEMMIHAATPQRLTTELRMKVSFSGK